MIFVLVGDDPAALELARAIDASGKDRLIAAALVGAIQAELMQVASGTRLTDRWDEFLTDGNVDAAIVAGNNPEALDAARQFAGAGKPLLLVPQASQGSAFLYELSLAHDDTGVLLFPAMTGRYDAAVAKVNECLAAGRFGRFQYLEFSRERNVNATSGPAALLTLEDVDEALLRDVDLLRYFGGDYNQVTALHTGAGSGGVASATVTLAGADLPQVTWTMKGSIAPSSWRLKIVGDMGTATLTGNDFANSELRIEPGGEQVPAMMQRATLPSTAVNVDSQSSDRGALMLARFRTAIEAHEPSRDWTDLIRAMETVEATHRSIRRRRTIDLYFESTSERSLFKTQMTAIGCGVLTFTFFAVVFLLVATTVLDVRDRQQVEAERAGGVIALSEFSGGNAELTPAGRAHLEELAPRMPAGRFTVHVERSESEPGLDDARRNAVVSALGELGVGDAEQRTVTAKIEGRWFAGALKIARIAVFAPLFIYLLLQLLLFLARPSAK